MADNSLRSRVLAGDALHGCFLTWPTAGMAELAALAGFDFLVLDAEHGFFTIESIASMVTAADAARIAAIVRVPSCAAAEIGRCLDAGAAGLLFPRGGGVADANASVLVAAQIETPGALEELDSIAREDGLDVLFVGPNDLTQALGVPGRFDDPRYREALCRIARAAREGGKTAGIMLARREQLPELEQAGFRFFTVSDRTLVLESGRAWRGAVPARG